MRSCSGSMRIRAIDMAPSATASTMMTDISRRFRARGASNAPRYFCAAAVFKPGGLELMERLLADTLVSSGHVGRATRLRSGALRPVLQIARIVRIATVRLNVRSGVARGGRRIARGAGRFEFLEPTRPARACNRIAVGLRDARSNLPGTSLCPGID